MGAAAGCRYLLDNLTVLQSHIALDDYTLHKFDRSLDGEVLGPNQRGWCLCQGLHLVNQLVVLVVKLDHWAAGHSQHHSACLCHLQTPAS